MRARAHPVQVPQHGQLVVQGGRQARLELQREQGMSGRGGSGAQVRQTASPGHDPTCIGEQRAGTSSGACGSGCAVGPLAVGGVTLRTTSRRKSSKRYLARQPGSTTRLVTASHACGTGPHPAGQRQQTEEGEPTGRARARGRRPGCLTTMRPPVGPQGCTRGKGVPLGSIRGKGVMPRRAACAHLRVGLLQLGAVRRGNGLPAPVHVPLHLHTPPSSCSAPHEAAATRRTGARATESRLQHEEEASRHAGRQGGSGLTSLVSWCTRWRCQGGLSRRGTSVMRQSWVVSRRACTGAPQSQRRGE